MATVKELLRAEEDGTLSFGDYTLASKTKLDNYEFEGDLYKVKTCLLYTSCVYRAGVRNRILGLQ